MTSHETNKTDVLTNFLFHYFFATQSRIDILTGSHLLMVDGEVKVGIGTHSRKLEFYQPTIAEWGWLEIEYTMPHYLKSHVHPDNIDRAKGEMLLLPTFCLPTPIHTRSANAPAATRSQSTRSACFHKLGKGLSKKPGH